MESYTLSPDELTVLSAIGPDEGATSYELTTATRLTPSEVFEVLTALSRRNLARVVDEPRSAKLTNEGQRVRLLIDRQRRQPFSSSVNSPIVVRDIEAEKNAVRKTIEELQPEQIDIALDTELHRLEQEAGQT